MKNKKIIFYNDKFVGWNNANTHIMDHSLHYGTTIFEGIKIKKNNNYLFLFRAQDHFLRLKNSAKLLNLKIPFSDKQIVEIIYKLIKKNKINQDCYMRIIVWFDNQNWGLSGTNLSKFAIIPIISKKTIFKPIKSVLISDFTKSHSKISQIKASGSYLLSYLAINEAKKKGFDEVFLFDEKFFLAEASTSNIFCVKNNIVYTPKTDAILLGVTRDTIITILKANKIIVKEANITRSFLQNCDEVFTSSTADGISKISKINNTKLPSQNIFSSLVSNEYKKAINGLNYKKYRWLKKLT